MALAGLSQSKLAILVSCSRSEVNRLVNGQRSGIELGPTWDAIAHHCGVPADLICYVVTPAA